MTAARVLAIILRRTTVTFASRWADEFRLLLTTGWCPA